MTIKRSLLISIEAYHTAHGIFEIEDTRQALLLLAAFLALFWGLEAARESPRS